MKSIFSILNPPSIPKFSKKKFLKSALEADKVMLWLMFIQWFISSFITSITFSTYQIGFIGGGVIFGVVAIGYRYFKGTRTFRNLVATALMLFSAIYIQQHLGRIEFHFHVFVAMAFLTLYEDIMPIFVASLVVIFHHLTFNYLQEYGVELLDTAIIIYNYGCGLDIVFLHAIFVIAEAIILAYIIRMNIEHSLRLIASEHDVKKLNKELTHSVMHDFLTGLPNRQNLHSKMELLIAEAKRSNNRFALLFIDLDNFKNINDSLGHHVGDELLKKVTKRVQDSLRASDILARLGGDEFIILLNNIKDEAEVINVISKELNLFRKEWRIGSHKLFISSSIGVAIFPDDGDTIEDLMKNADIAMYRAKELGRDNFSFFTKYLDKKVHEAVEIEHDLNHALAKDEFRLFYQPKVDVATGKIIGAEALIRWEHPKRGLVYPDTFIHLAESTGFILKLGKWVMDETIDALQRWDNENLDLNISFNVSTRQFQHSNILEELSEKLQSSSVNPSKIYIEITESIMMESLSKTIEQLSKIKELGVKISMDDFGTGYSSLAYLQKFPIDSLKIDKSFVDEIRNDGKETVLFNTILSMGKNLGLNIVAEGIEEEYQLEYLKRKNCPYYQGYYFSKAIREEEFIKLVKQQNR